MMDLPQTFGSLTLVRTLGRIGAMDAYEAFLGEPGRLRVFVRHAHPAEGRDPMEQAAVETRAKDLAAVRHPLLVSVLDAFREGDHLFVVEEWVDGITLAEVVGWCRQTGTRLSKNALLHLATQVCDGLEALHDRPGKATGQPHVLHLALRPDCVFVTPEGTVRLGGYGLRRAPVLPAEGADAEPQAGLEYLSPEQTHTDQKLLPTSDVFALGTVLYELATLHPLFREDTPQRTIQRVRRAEVGSRLHGVGEILPGLDKVLHRALSLSPKHRSQRAFVVKEDLCGLVAADGLQDADPLACLAPLLGSGPLPPALADPSSTASFAARALAERAASLEERDWNSASGEAEADTPVVVATGLKPDPDFPMPQEPPETEPDTRPWAPGQPPAPPTPPHPLPTDDVETVPRPPAGDSPPPSQRAVGMLVLVGVAGVLVLAGLLWVAWSLGTRTTPSPRTPPLEAASEVAIPTPVETPVADVVAQVERTEGPPPPEAPAPPPVRPAEIAPPEPDPGDSPLPPVADIGPTDREPPNSHALLDRFASAAAGGKLTPSDVLVIERVQDDDLGFDRSRMLLVMNARARQDDTALKLYLDELSRRPENAYNPVILVEYARYHANKGDYERAIDKARLAERHWARMPSDLIFLKKAEIYEVLAASHQGLFYRSEDDIDLLDAALGAWRRYREHVGSGSRADLVTRADREIAKLETIRKRLR